MDVYYKGDIMKQNMYDLTTPQKSILLTDEFYKGSCINNVCGTAIIEDIIDFGLLKEAVNLVIKNNDSFRFQLYLENNEVKQYVKDYEPIHIEIVDVNTKEDVKKIENNLMGQVFDIYSNLYTFKLFRFPNGSGGFLLNIHHIISDSWTLGLTAKEIVRVYASLKKEEKVDFSIFSSYVDYIESEKEYRNSDKFKKDKEYWDSIFSTIPEVASIPSIKETSNDFDCTANRLVHTIDENEMKKINDFCTKNRISVFNFFMAIYSIYVGRVSNLEDFVIGTPILNRTNFKEKNTTGMFINIAPFRICTDSNLSFKSFASNLAKDSMSMLRHQKYSYQYILEDLRKQNSSLPSLYRVILSYQVTKANTENGLSYETRWAFNGCTGDDVDIHLFDINDTGSLNVAYDYRVDKYTKEDIHDMHERIIYMINQVLSKEDISIGNVSIVTPKEKYEILYGFNNTDAQYPADKTIVQLFEEQVEKTPNNIAIKLNNSSMTYDELNKKSNQLAHYLINFGIKQNDVIGLRLNKSLEMIVGIFGILKAGACYLPIDLSYPQERVDFMLTDSNAKMFLTNKEHSADLDISIHKQLLDLSNKDIYFKNTENPNNINSPDDLIYIIYTSGSTGTPKGVMLMHKNIVRLVKNDHFLFDFNAQDVWTMFHSVAFDFSVWEMYACLLYGGKLILVSENTAKDPNQFLTLLRNEKVTVLNQTPTYFYNLLDMELLKSDSNLAIRYIIYGGEALNPILIRPWKNKYPNTKLINMYGITETTVHVTFKELNEEDLRLPYSNIGKPIPTLKVYVMDKNLNLMPYGVEGEMCVAGLGLCKGYLNRPELNETKFVKNPYNSEEMLYHSADSAILGKDGNLYYKGRIDNQVKIRGFRVELGEIETKLLKHPNVVKCIVLPRKDNRDCHLIAYIVTNKTTSSSILKDYISNLVPTYMVPNYFVFVDDIPLTSNGKTDRKTLLNMKLTLEKETPYAAPRSDFEKLFINILESCLHLENIGIDDNILELGADSLTLMKLTIELLEKNYIVNIQDIYEFKTVRSINDRMNHKPKELANHLNEHLHFNFEENLDKQKFSFEHVLLTGATGYLGVHILNDLIQKSNSIIYCLIRDKDNVDAKERLIKKLEFYFGKDILKHMNSRIKVINGNVTISKFGLSNVEYDNLGKTIDMAIHSAAIVSHYGDKNLFDTINVLGTDHMIEFCKIYRIRLNHISTTSISANVVEGSNKLVSFDEHCLYIGQNYNDNIYVKSKFEAEYRIHLAMKDGLIASVYRLGNITARISDGKFQENDTQNAFLNRIVAFSKLQRIPQTFANISIDLSPVDECSNMITSLLSYESSYGKVFHIFNNHRISVLGILEYLDGIGKHIEVVSPEEFNDFVSKIPMKDTILGIINDITSNLSKTNINVELSSNFTISCMNNYGLYWSVPNLDYLNNFLGKYVNGDECDESDEF